MSFGEAVNSALFRNYANFQGRAARPEFWWFMLAILIASLVATVIDAYVIGPRIFESLVTLGTIVPSLSVGARRLHDTDRSGWWQLLSLIPVIGMIVLIVWWASAGWPGDNRFGRPPVA